MELSKRLKTVADAVTPGHRLADIGTDHGYVPVYLVKQNICPGALAVDMNSAPLARAREHIMKEGLEDRIQTRLGAGLEKLAPQEVDTIVMAGMGGGLICRILDAALEFLGAGKELVLQPQSEWFKVRYFLHDHFYEIQEEWFLEEDGKYYVVIKAVPDEEVYYRYGRYLIRERNPALLEYLKKEYQKKETIILNMEKQGRSGLSRYREIKKEMEDINKVIQKSYSA